MEVEIASPSLPQMKKMHMGHPFRATLGSGLKIHVPVSTGKKLMKASMKGMGATVDSCRCMGCGMCGGNVIATSKDSSKRLITAGTDRAVRALEGSGNLKKTIRDSAKRLLVSSTDRAIRALEGSGNVKDTAKDSSKRLITAGTDRAVRALEGSGRGKYYRYNEGTGEYEQYYPNRRGGAVPLMKKMEKKLDKEKNDLMDQMNKQMKKQSSIVKKAKEAMKTKSATVNKDLMNQVSQQVKKTKQLMSKAQDLREEAVDNLQGQMKHYANKMTGGKVNRRKKFDQWFKSIGSKFKTLNHNLAPIKKAATDRAVQIIKFTNNPVAQGKALLDMAKDEMGDDDVSVPPSATTQMMNQGVSPEMLSQAVGSNSFSNIQAEAQPVDVNQDGETDGYFYPREMSYFGAGMKSTRMYRPNLSRGKGMHGGMGVTVHGPRGNTRHVKVGGLADSSVKPSYSTGNSGMHGVSYGQYMGNGVEMGRPTIMPVTRFETKPVKVIQRPAPLRVGMGAKKSSPWIEHVKAYASKHGVKYGEALKLAKSTYKKGGALYPAGYDPRYD